MQWSPPPGGKISNNLVKHIERSLIHHQMKKILSSFIKSCLAINSFQLVNGVKFNYTTQKTSSTYIYSNNFPIDWEGLGELQLQNLRNLVETLETLQFYPNLKVQIVSELDQLASEEILAYRENFLDYYSHSKSCRFWLEKIIMKIHTK